LTILDFETLDGALLPQTFKLEVERD
jgi:hypothetical protein